MTDHDALVRAVCEHPDDDTPRLIYADYLEETGEPDRAAFVRAQVELARTPAWEPFAVRCRHRQPEWGAEGRPFRHTLPALPAESGVWWHEQPFRRGFGWRVHVRSLAGWAAVAPRLLDRAPVGELDLNPPATLDDWRGFAAGDWVRRLRVVRLDGTSPVEPIRVLSHAPGATGMTDIHFQRATSPGLPELVEDLLRTPLGRAVRGLHFRMGYQSLEYLVDALTPGGTGVERLTLAIMGLTPYLIDRWWDRGGLVGLSELDLRGNDTLWSRGVWSLAAGLRARGPGIHSLGLAGTQLGDDGVDGLARCEGLTGLRQLDLSRNSLTDRGIRALAGSEHLSGLRSLSLAACNLGDASVRELVRAKFWPNLVELDLRGNAPTRASARRLRTAPLPPDLTALRLGGSRLDDRARRSLLTHFGERVDLDDDPI